MFEDMMGFNQHLLCDDPQTRQGCLNWMERVRAGLGDDNSCVDIQLIKHQLMLNKKTVDYIYSDFTCMEDKYVPGARPFLEKVLAEIITPDMSEKQKFLAIFRRCRDNREAARPEVKFSGGTEEELIKRGVVTCHEISRVFVVLCQIAGIPARLTCTHIYGHMMAEAFVDGKWAWCDPRHGSHAYADDGTLASFWDMICDPTIIDRQERSVWDESRPSYYLSEDIATAFAEQIKARQQAIIRECTFHPKEAFAVGNYYVWDHATYDYPWAFGSADPVKKEAVLRKESAMRVSFGYPPSYWDYRCHSEPLRVKGE